MTDIRLYSFKWIHFKRTIALVPIFSKHTSKYKFLYLLHWNPLRIAFEIVRLNDLSVNN